MAATERAGDYEHRSHAGNKGDVWKHLILWEALSDLLEARTPGTTERFVYADTHAGRAFYPDLRELREYCKGFGRFRDQERWLDVSGYFAVESGRHGWPHDYTDGYYGSCGLVHHLLRRTHVDHKLHLWDICEHVAACLASYFGDELENSVFVHRGNGYDGLRKSGLEPHLTLIDPPTADWSNIREILGSVQHGTVIAWYPLQSSSEKGEVSKERERKLSSTRAPVFQVQWARPTGCSHQTVGCGVLVQGASQKSLKRLDEVLPAIAAELAAGAVASPYYRG